MVDENEGTKTADGGAGTSADDEAIERALARATRRNRVLSAVAGLVLLGGVGWAVLPWFVDAFLSDVEDLEPPLVPVAAQRLGEVPIAELHASLLPEWGIALSRGDADAAFGALSRAVESNPDLADLVRRLYNSQVQPDQPAGIQMQPGLVNEWNAWMRANNQPFAVQQPMSGRLRRHGFLPLTYYVPARLLAQVGDQSFEVELATRLDSINIVEGYTGHATSDGEARAFVLIDIVAEEAANDVWPALDPVHDIELDPRQRLLADQMRAQVQAGLSADAWDVLQRTAPARHQLVTTLRQIEARQECGGGMVFPVFPLRGYAADMTQEWRETRARPANGGGCFMISFEEVDAIREASDALERAPGLRQALYELIALNARTTFVHEVQHCVDHEVNLSHPELEPLGGNPVFMELSAFLATLAEPSLNALELFNVCARLNELPAAHAIGYTHVLEELGFAACEGTPPDDIAGAANALRQRWFGRAPAIPIPEGYPTQLRGARF